MYTPSNLKPYERPSHYFGPEFNEYYPVIGRHRDSDCLANANFDATLKALGGESKRTNGVYVAKAGHWAVGWVETIYVHRSATVKLKIADTICGKLADYPVVDEDLWSRYEDEAKHAIYFDCFDLRDRIRECVKAGLSMFAARGEYIPDRVYDRLEV